MAIERAAATANDTLDQTSDTLIVGLTITPPEGDYLLFSTVTFQTTTSAGAEFNTFSVYVGGIQIPHSERVYHEDTSVDDTFITMALSCKVSPNGSQTVEIRHRTSNSSSPIVAKKRELALFPIPAVGTDYEQSAIADDTIASATYATLDSMSVTPVSGNYLLVFTTSGLGPPGSELGFRVVVGGTVVPHSIRSTFQETSAADDEVPILIAVAINPNGSQLVEIQWARITGSGTITVHERTMNLIPTDAGDIFEASGTVDDTDSTTTDKQIDDLLIPAPGAADYLAIFSTTDHYGSMDSSNDGETTYSIRTAGVKVVDSERINEHENSLDNTNMVGIAGGRITVAGASDDVQMYWQSSTTVTRISRERTLVLLREFSGATINVSGLLDGQSAAISRIQRDLKIAATLESVSQTESAMLRKKMIVSILVAQSQTDSFIKRTRGIVATVAGVSRIISVIQRLSTLLGNTVGQSEVESRIQRTLKLGGSIITDSVMDLLLERIRAMTSKVIASSGDVGVIQRISSVLGAIKIASSLHSSIRIESQLAVIIHAGSQAYSSISGNRLLNGVVEGLSSLSVDFSRIIGLQSTIYGMSLLDVTSRRIRGFVSTIFSSVVAWIDASLFIITGPPRFRPGIILGIINRSRTQYEVVSRSQAQYGIDRHSQIEHVVIGRSRSQYGVVNLHGPQYDVISQSQPQYNIKRAN